MSGFTSTPISGPYADMLDESFGVQNAFYEFNPGKCLMPPYFADIAQQILDARVKDDDVWLVSFPRTGSTWCQEMIWLIGNDLDFDEANKTIQQMRAPMIELSTYFAEYENFIKDYGNSVEIVNNWPSPRFIKTHLPFELLPTELDKVKPKVIYVARHPKDLCVSYYHHCKLFHHMNTTFETFCEMFLGDVIPIGPVFHHYLKFWQKRDEENILFLKYEDLKRDTKGSIRVISKFLDKELSDAQVDELADFLSFDKMRKNPACNMAPILDSQLGKDFQETSGKCFIRQGKIGDWENHMDDAMSSRFDEWIEKKTKGTGLTFD